MPRERIVHAARARYNAFIEEKENFFGNKMYRFVGKTTKVAGIVYDGHSFKYGRWRKTMEKARLDGDRWLDNKEAAIRRIPQRVGTITEEVDE